MKIHKLVLAAVGATVLLGSLVASSASGRIFQVDNQSLRALFNEVIFREPTGSSFNCRVTLEGSLHSSTIDKTAGTLVGYITRTIVNNCVAGGATVQNETLPWHIRYSGFEGALPNIRSIVAHVIGASFRTTLTNGIRCHIRSTLAEPVRARLHVDASPSHHVRVGFEGTIRTGAECFGVAATLSTEVASRYVVLLGTSTPISVSLI
jgi:hypothetical protein